MIKTDFVTVIFLYLFVLAVAPLIVWLILEHGWKVRRSTESDKTFWQCPVCTHIYRAPKDQSISVCPKCKSYNRKEVV